MLDYFKKTCILFGALHLREYPMYTVSLNVDVLCKNINMRFLYRQKQMILDHKMVSIGQLPSSSLKFEISYHGIFWPSYSSQSNVFHIILVTRGNLHMN